MIPISALNHKFPSHALKAALKSHLRLTQLARHLDLHCRENGDFPTDHIGRNLNFCPATKIGPALGGGMEGTGLLEDNQVRRAADDFTRPAHTGVDAEQSLTFRESG